MVFGKSELSLAAMRFDCSDFGTPGTLIVLTNGFAKKTDKTPAREITLAEQRKKDYLSRKKQI
jgi:hypothetical protein